MSYVSFIPKWGRFLKGSRFTSYLSVLFLLTFAIIIQLHNPAYAQADTADALSQPNSTSADEDAFTRLEEFFRGQPAYNTQEQKEPAENKPVAPPKQNDRQPTQPPQREVSQAYEAEMARGHAKANTGKIRILTKSHNDASAEIAADMAYVLNDLGKMRVLPVLGSGALQSVTDLLYLKGVDLSIIQSDVLDYIKRKQVHTDISKRLRYVAKLYQSEMHLVASLGIKSIHDLQGQKVGFGLKEQGVFISAQAVLDNYGIKVEPVYVNFNDAVKQVLAGELAAAFTVAGKPSDYIRKLDAEQGLHFLAIENMSGLAKSYQAANLTHEDYPAMISPGQSIPTVAVSEVLTIFNWDKSSSRYKDMAKFIGMFFKNYNTFLTPERHHKWEQVNLASELEGWNRFKPAANALKTHNIKLTDNQQTEFFKFLKAQSPDRQAVSEAEKKQLYKQYTEWLKGRGRDY